MENVTATAVVPLGMVCASVRLPSDVDVPQSNHTMTEPPPGLTLPFRVAPLDVTAVASPVVATTFVAGAASPAVVNVLMSPFVMDGVPVSEYAATAPNKNIDTMIPKVREKFIDYPPW